MSAPQGIDLTAIGPFPDYCDGYGRPGATGLGYVSVLKVETGAVVKTDDALLDGIVAYDRAEANGAYIGQINMGTASSFCGIAGQVWGLDLAQADAIPGQQPKMTATQQDPDHTPLPVYDAAPLLEAGEALFGNESSRRFPPAPGAHVICANKSVTALRPASGQLAEGQAYGVWCMIALSRAVDRSTQADLFIEDAGLWTTNDDEQDLAAFVDDHWQQVVWSIVACGADQNVVYDRTYIGAAYRMMQPGEVGTALTCAPYVVLAQNAVPPQGFGALNTMTLSEWDASVGNGVG